MKMKFSLLIAAALTSQIAFANDLEMKLIVKNNTAKVGRPYISSSVTNIDGPLLAKDASAPWKFKIGARGMIRLGMIVPHPIHPRKLCQIKDSPGMLVLTPENYRGDIITVTYHYSDSSGITCECSGSACDTWNQF